MSIEKDNFFFSNKYLVQSSPRQVFVDAPLFAPQQTNIDKKISEKKKC